MRQPVSSTRRVLAAAIAAALLPAVVQADPTNAELLQKIEELSQKVLVLERRLEVRDEATKAVVTTAPVVKAGPRGFSLASADSQNQIKLRGVIHIDGRFFGNDDKEYAARVFAHPFGDSESFALRGLGVGIAGTYTSQTGTTAQPLLPVLRTPAQSTFFRYRSGTTPTLADGERTRLAPQLYYYVGRFGLLGEYTTVSQDVSRTTTAGRREDTLDTTAWQVQASWFLTGEEESFRGYKPNNVFSLADDSWGAFELVARYQELDPDDAAFVDGAASFADPVNAASKATAYGLGLNWHLNENLKWVLNYDRTSFDGGAADGADREDEDVFLTRFALGF